MSCVKRFGPSKSVPFRIWDKIVSNSKGVSKPGRQCTLSKHEDSSDSENEEVRMGGEAS